MSQVGPGALIDTSGQTMGDLSELMASLVALTNTSASDYMSNVTKITMAMQIKQMVINLLTKAFEAAKDSVDRVAK
jgi:hypothetical protein